MGDVRAVPAHHEVVKACRDFESPQCEEAIGSLSNGSVYRASESLKWVFSNARQPGAIDAASGVVAHFVQRANDERRLRPAVRSILTHAMEEAPGFTSEYEPFDGMEFDLGSDLFDALMRRFAKGSWLSGSLLISRAKPNQLRRNVTIFRRLMDEKAFAGGYHVYVRAAWLYWRAASRTDRERVDMITDALENSDDRLMRCGAALELRHFVDEPGLSSQVRGALHMAAEEDDYGVVRSVADDVLQGEMTSCWQ